MKIVKTVLLCVFFAALMYLSGAVKIYLNFTPVPFMLQLPVCLISGALAGPYSSSFAMLLSLLPGSFGIPVFAGIYPFSDFSYIGGYIIGYMPCAFITGKLTRYFYKPWGSFFMRNSSIFVSMAISVIILYLFEAVFFSIVHSSGFLKAVGISVMPFIWIDFVKIVASTLLAAQALEMSHSGDLRGFSKKAGVNFYKI